MKNAKGVSHTGKVRGQFHADELAVLFFTGMDLVTLTDFKMDAGKEWLMKYCEAEDILRHADELWKMPDLLQWWNLEWRRMDHFMILPILHQFAEDKREEVYRELHCDVFLSTHPQNELMQRAFKALLNNQKTGIL